MAGYDLKRRLAVEAFATAEIERSRVRYALAPTARNRLLRFHDEVTGKRLIAIRS